VARLLAGGWSLASASPDASGGVAILEKRMAGSLADDWLMTGWSLASAFSGVPDGTTFLEKRMAGSLPDVWLMSGWWCLVGVV